MRGGDKRGGGGKNRCNNGNAIYTLHLPLSRGLFLFLIVSEDPTNEENTNGDDHDGNYDTSRGSHFFNQIENGSHF